METRKGGEFLPGPFPGGRAATQVRPYASIAAYSSPRRGGTKPAPYRGRSRRVAGCAWGVASASTPRGGGTRDGTPGRRALRVVAESRRDCPGQRRTAERSREMGRNCGRDYPQRGQQRRTIPQSPCGRQLPLHKGAFGDGDTDCRVASLLAMTVLILCHSEEAQRADVGIRFPLVGSRDRPGSA